jgi:curved DNA-binding protein CbpA
MNLNKDYYRTLGVLQDAEDIIIKAAYRALAQKYHPDKFQNNPKTAESRMQDINEAYTVLSDPLIRKQYDENRVKSEYEEYPTEDTEDLLHTLDKDWSDALEYFPDLVEIASKLSTFSKTLEYTFKVIVIEKKEFNNRQALAENLKLSYFEKYFGTNKKVHEFAEILYSYDRRDLLKKLNRAVNLLGSDVNPSIIIDKIAPELYKNNSSKSNNPFDLANKLLNMGEYYYANADEYEDISLRFLKSINLPVNVAGFWDAIFNIRFYVTSDSVKYKFSSLQLVDFAIDKAKKFLREKS